MKTVVSRSSSEDAVQPVGVPAEVLEEVRAGASAAEGPRVVALTLPEATRERAA